MRRIVESTLLSLDGVIGDPHLWASERFDDEARARALEQLRASDAARTSFSTATALSGRRC